MKFPFRKGVTFAFLFFSLCQPAYGHYGLRKSRGTFLNFAGNACRWSLRGLGLDVGVKLPWELWAQSVPLPHAHHFRVVELKRDPEFPDSYLYRAEILRRYDRFGAEQGSLLALNDKFPERLALLGIRVVVENGRYYVEYPNVRGLNARIKRLNEAGHPGAPAVHFWSDYSEGVTDGLAIARHWGHGKMVVSVRGWHPDNFSLHFHDLFAHGFGYLALPREIAEVSQGQMATLVRLYDDPILRINERFRELVEAEILERVGNLDSASALLATSLGLHPPQNLLKHNLWVTYSRLAGPESALAEVFKSAHLNEIFDRTERTIWNRLISEEELWRALPNATIDRLSDAELTLLSENPPRVSTSP